MEGLEEHPSPSPPPGPPRGAAAARAGTSSARRWRGKYLGPAFDIHGGGVDLRFPHHENELAQSRAAGKPFASYWLHNAWITTAGEKMSKSLGNSLLVPSVLERVRGIELRFYMVSAHYRSHVEFSFEALDEAATSLPADRDVPRARGRDACGEVAERRHAVRRRSSPRWTTTSARRRRSPSIHDRVREGNRLLADGGDADGAARHAASVRAMLDVLGLDPADPGWADGSGGEASSCAAPSTYSSPHCSRSGPRRAPTRTGLAPTRSATGIKAAGIEIEDTPSGPKWSI